jgi:hypothetical protein
MQCKMEAHESMRAHSVYRFRQRLKNGQVDILDDALEHQQRLRENISISIEDMILIKQS